MSLNSKIVRVTIGLKENTNPWEIKPNKRSAIIDRDSVFARIKLAKPLYDEYSLETLTDMFTRDVIRKETKDDFISSHTVGKFPTFKTEISKDNYNILMKKIQDDSEGDSLVILDLFTKVHLLRYMSDYEIINTYHSVKEKNVKPTIGCFIKIPSGLPDDAELCRLQVLEKEKFYQYIVTMSSVQRFEIENPTVIATLKKIRENKVKYKIQTGFTVNPSDFPSVVITASVKDEEYNSDEYVKNLIKEVGDCITSHYPSMEETAFAIAVIPESFTDDEIVETIKETMKEITPTMVKTITSYNSRLTRKVIAKLKVNYVFALSKDGTLKTIKSN